MDRWGDLQRVEAWAGEIRVNFLRMAAAAGFYGYHLLNVYALDPKNETIRGNFHLSVTGLVVAWFFSIVVLHFCLSRRFVPPWLKFAAVAWDTFLVTMLIQAWGGPKSPLIILFFLIVASSALRLDLRLVWTATGLCLAAWVFLLGFSKFYRPETEHVARTAQILFALGLGAAGLFAGQSVRQARRLAQGYSVTVKDPKK